MIIIRKTVCKLSQIELSLSLHHILNEIDNQATKVRKVIMRNKYSVTSPELNISQRKKNRTEEKLTLMKKRGVRASTLNKAVFKVKEAKKRMNNVITIEWNTLFKSKFDAGKDDLKTTIEIVNQLLKNVHCSNFPSHANEKTLTNSPFYFLTQLKVKTIKDNFKMSS